MQQKLVYIITSSNLKINLKPSLAKEELHFQEVKNKDYLLQEHLSENLKLCY